MLLRSALLLAFAVLAHAQDVGQVLPQWSEGILDIHQINTGKGNSTLFVLPDGTTMLLDAGAGSRI